MTLADRGPQPLRRKPSLYVVCRRHRAVIHDAPCKRCADEQERSTPEDALLVRDERDNLREWGTSSSTRTYYEQ